MSYATDVPERPTNGGWIEFHPPVEQPRRLKLLRRPIGDLVDDVSCPEVELVPCEDEIDALL